MFFNLQITMISAAMLVLVLLSSERCRIRLSENTSFRRLIIHMLILLALDFMVSIFNSRHFPGAYLINLMLNYLYYGEQAVIGYIWGVYSYRLIRMELAPAGRWIHRIPLVLALVLVIWNPITKIFIISSENVYGRGWGIWGILYTVCMLFYLLEAMFLAAYHLLHSPLQERKDGWSLLVSSALPVLGTAIQIVCFGVNTIWSWGSLGILILYVNVQARHIAMAEQELERIRTNLMISQIQPHFLYNVLTGIKELCGSNSQKAEDAMGHFSRFLRRNLESLSEEKLILFSSEISHVKDYFCLEKMRFEDRISLVLDLNFVDFQLPPLTIQPLVENAVRYGITKKRGGGTITIRSQKQGDQIIIMICDDGVGFDIDAPKENGHTHTGIQNVRRRLEIECRGSLTIDSEKDVGTKVQIILPGKEEKL